MGSYAHVIPDHVVELIFLRLDSSVSLLRAASTCKQWRRVVAGAGFLRQFRSLRGQPPVAGMYYDKPRVPRQRPDFVASPWVDDDVDGRFFSLDFLPDSDLTPWVWRILDSRGSLLLFGRLRDPRGRCTSFGDVVICEPLTRRYVMVDPRPRFAGYNVADAFLVDGESAAGGIGMASFRVVFKLHIRGIHSHAGLFTFTVGRNRDQSPSCCWRKISINALMLDARPSDELAPTSLYWFNQGRRVVSLDRSTAKFSSLLLPEVEGWNFHKENYDMIVAAGHDGTARIVILDLGAEGHLMVFARLLQGSGEWALVRRIRLAAVARDLPGYDPSFFSDTLMMRIPDASTPVLLLSPRQETKWWFHLDIETMEVAPAFDHDYAKVYPCELPWPPTLHACSYQ